MHRNGRGVLEDRERAVPWFRKAAAQGNLTAVRALQLAKLAETESKSESEGGNSGQKVSMIDESPYRQFDVGAA